jgi:hypothetical protein
MQNCNLLISGLLFAFNLATSEEPKLHEINY